MGKDRQWLMAYETLRDADLPNALRWNSGRGGPQCHLRDLQGFTCYFLQVKPPAPGRGRMVARLESSGR